jgi:hypothetical protein
MLDPVVQASDAPFIIVVTTPMAFKQWLWIDCIGL